ncbi:hypothetical protein F4604DRAFT_1922421 [Suillus subluteus]|nr:hypothetical protein F4604DRAFT_1922421 [Suillus subluteus]
MAIESSSDHDDGAVIVRAKRCIVALEQEVEALRASSKCTGKLTLMCTKDKPFIGLCPYLLYSPDQLASIQDEDRTVNSVNELLCCLPWLKKKLSSDVDELNSILKDLCKGVDSARGDDTANLKHTVVAWLTEIFHPLGPPLYTNIKDDCRFIHHITAQCSINVLTACNRTKEKIRDRDPDFLVTAYSWPVFLYLDYTFDSSNIEKGLFHSALLLKAFKHIFTSPSSVKEIEGDGNGADAIMAFTPQSITYTACQLRFSLSNVNSWWSIDRDFDYYVFYNNIVDFFEVAPGIDTQSRIKELLKWWNR